MPYYVRKNLLPDSQVVDTTTLSFVTRCYIIQVLDSYGVFGEIAKLRVKRNDLLHMSDDEKNMGDQQFNKYWDEISQLLTGFGCDLSRLKHLKTVKGRIEQDIYIYIFFFFISK